MDVLSRNFETCNESGAESQLTMGKRGKHRRYWSRGADLNRRPADYESAALPTELPRRKLNLTSQGKGVKRVVRSVYMRCAYAKMGMISC